MYILFSEKYKYWYILPMYNFRELYITYLGVNNMKVTSNKR